MTTDAYRHTVVLQNPGPAVPDGDGGSTQSWTDLAPRTWKCSIEPATAKDLERITSGTVLATATEILKGRHRADVTTQTRVIFGGRVLSVTGVGNPEERNITLELACVEVVA